MPEGKEQLSSLGLKEIYSRVRNWYQSNEDKIESDPKCANWDPVFKEHVKLLIGSLPPPNVATQLEMQVVLGEANRGNLEWAFHESDGQFKIGQYARSPGQERTLGSLTPEEKQQLEKSPIRPYLFDKWVEKRDQTN